MNEDKVSLFPIQNVEFITISGRGEFTADDAAIYAHKLRHLMSQTRTQRGARGFKLQEVSRQRVQVNATSWSVSLARSG